MFVLLAISGGCFGLLTAAGVFTVLVAVGLVPRFAGKTHTADKVLLFEEMVILGAIGGGIYSIFPDYIQPLEYLRINAGQWTALWDALGILLLVTFGLFAGMFVGCLALAIAEMLDSIPIFARRVSFRHGLGIAVLGMAVGKVCGSLWYFYYEIHGVLR